MATAVAWLTRHGCLLKCDWMLSNIWLIQNPQHFTQKCLTFEQHTTSHRGKFKDCFFRWALLKIELGGYFWTASIDKWSQERPRRPTNRRARHVDGNVDYGVVSF